jgi:hypothetical protein
MTWKVLEMTMADKVFGKVIFQYAFLLWQVHPVDQTVCLLIDSNVID